MARPLGTTSLRILAAIRDGACYGLDIVQRTGLASGTVYPTLGRLADRELVTSRWEEEGEARDEGRPRRRYYALSPEGARVLAQGIARLSSTVLELAPEKGR